MQTNTSTKPSRHKKHLPSKAVPSPLGMYQVMRETWGNGFRDRRSIIQ